MIERIKTWWQAEATRHFLWVPACFGAGIAGYYAAPIEPPLWLLPMLAALAVTACAMLRRSFLPPLLAIALVLSGGAYANIRAQAHHPVMLHEALEPRETMGVVRDIERTEHGVRLLLDQVMVADLPAEQTPKQVRLSVRFKKDAAFELPHIGDAIAMRAGLMPAMGPALPGGFDFARFFYLRDIGAIGYGLPPWQILGANEPPDIATRFWTWRSRMTDSIVRELGPEVGGIAAGFITGDARAITDADFVAMRASNLYHIIAISGEHMVVISGVIFVALRLLLLLVPGGFGQRPEGKSAVAAITLALVSVYLFVTGLPMSAVRAYVMIALVLFAVIVRRQVDALRSLAITAFVMLLYDPTSLLDPGFQLSFAATLALIALIDFRLVHRLPEGTGRLRRVLHAFGTMILVSVVAEAATVPLVVSMFNNVSPYGVFANSIATPLVSFYLMPLVALFFILLPLGLQSIALTLMKYGILGLLGIGRWVAGFWHAQVFAPALPDWGLALFVIGLLWICLWRTRVRRWGLVPAIIGAASVFTTSAPDMLIGGTLKQIAFRGADGLVLARGRPTSMMNELWANGTGYVALPQADAPDWRCDKLGCVAEVKGQNVAFPTDMAAMIEDCARSQTVVTLQAGMGCDGARVIGPKQLKDSNVAAFWMSGKNGLRFETSADWQGVRPWSVRVEEE